MTRMIDRTSIFTFLEGDPRVSETADEDLWKLREEHRTTRGYYTHVWKHTIAAFLPRMPEPLKIPADHFLHDALSNTDGLVAYTKSADHGQRDIQTRVKFGKYLKEHCPYIPDNLIAEIANAFRVATCRQHLRFTTEPDEIEEVYCNGPSSCMSHGPDDYDTYGIHPARAYGNSPNLALAYVVEDERIIARTIVNTVTQLWSSTYGNAEAMRKALTDAGYTHSYDALVDGILQYIEHPDSPTYAVVPWVDGCSNGFLMHEEKRIILSPRNTPEDGTYTLVCLSSTSGSARVGEPCGICGQVHFTGQMHHAFVAHNAGMDCTYTSVCPTCVPALIRPLEYSCGRFKECDWQIAPSVTNLRHLPDGRVVHNVNALLADGWTLDENDTWIEPIRTSTEAAA